MLRGGPLSMQLMAADAAGLLDSLGLGRVHVSGLSLGSCVAQELALARPEQVASLQLHGTWGTTAGYAGRKFRAQLQLLDTLSVAAFYEINVLWFLTPEHMERRGPEELSADVSDLARRAPEAEVLRQQYQADLEHESLPRLHAINCPTLVTVGSADLAAPPLYARQVQRAIGGETKLHVFEGGGHLHNMEKPHEFNAATLEFLRQHR